MGVNLNKISHRLIFAFLFPLISIGSSYLTSNLINSLQLSQYLLLAVSIDILGCYAFLYWLFNNIIWKFIPINFWQIVEYPDLSGRWEGKLYSTYSNKKTPYKCVVEIKQSFSDIKIICYFSNSSSYSRVSGFYKEQNDEIILVYDYFNNPNPGAPETMHAHAGIAKHILKDAKTMQCFYYNEPFHGRGNSGNYQVKLVSRKLMHHV